MNRRHRVALALTTAWTLVGIPGVAVAAPGEEGLSEEKVQEAKTFYEEGRRAYRKGDMALAVEKFEGAYDLTENPIILYNIGLAYRRLYDETRNIIHLRRAKVVLENFRLELARDSGLGSPDEVAKLLVEVEKRLEKDDPALAGEASGDEGQTDAAGDGSDDGASEGPTDPTQSPDDPGPATGGGRKLKIAGFATLGTGVTLGIGAGVVAGIFSSRRNADLDALDTSVAEAQAAGCTDSSTDTLCRDYLDQREALTLRANVNRGRALAGGIGLGAAAAAGIGAGVALIVIGKKRDAPETARVQVAPWGRGVSFSGRF